jgi:hypothetical protein
MANPQPQQSSANPWKWIGCGCATTLLLLLGLGIGALYLIKQTFNMSFDAQTSEAVARSIMDYEIPGGSKGLISMNIEGVEIAGIASTQEDVFLMLGKMPSQLSTDLNPEELEQQIQKSMAEQAFRNFKSSVPARVESKQVCDQTVSVSVLEGEANSGGSSSPQPAVSYQALLKQEQGIFFIALTTSGENAQEHADQVFQSLQCK